MNQPGPTPRPYVSRLIASDRLRTAVNGSLGLNLWLLLFAGLCQVVPVVPKATWHAGKAPHLHAFLADGKTLVTSGNSDFPHQGPIDLWDVATGQRRLSVAGDWVAVREVKVSPDDKVFTTLDRNDHLAMWETATGQKVEPFAEFQKELGWTDCRDKQFSPDGRFLILEQRRATREGPYFLFFWEVETQALRARIEGYLADLMIDKDGKQMAIFHRAEPSHFRVERWRLDARFPDTGPFQVHDVSAHKVAISPKLDTFATAHKNAGPDNGDIQLWDLATGKEKAKIVYFNPDPPNNQLRFSPNGRFLTVDNPHRFNQIYWQREPPGPPPLWDTEAGLKEVGGGLDALHISADDRRLLAKSKTGEVELYDTATFRKLGNISVPGEGTISIAMGQTFSPSAWDLYQFTPDSKAVLVTGMISFGHDNAITDFLGQYIPAFRPTFPRVVRLWDVETGQQIAAFTDCWHALYAPDGKTVATAHEDGTIRIWDVPPRKPVLALFGVSLVLWLAPLVGVQLLGRLLRRFRRRRAAQ